MPPGIETFHFLDGAPHSIPSTMPTGPQHDSSPTVELMKTRTGFEAETIAAALRDRGVDARAIDSHAGVMISNVVAPPSVIVLADHLDAAQHALEEIKSEASAIDWSQVDVGEGNFAPPAPGSRWAWTISVLLVPIGILVLSYGTQRGDRTIQAIGAAVLGAAIVIAVALMVNPGRSAGRNTDD